MNDLERRRARKRNTLGVNARAAAARRVAKRYPGLFQQYLAEERAKRGLNGT